MRIYDNDNNSKNIMNDLPADVKAILELCYDDSYVLYASHSFIDLAEGDSNDRVFSTPIGTGYTTALRLFIDWVRSGKMEEFHYELHEWHEEL